MSWVSQEDRMKGSGAKGLLHILLVIVLLSDSYCKARLHTQPRSVHALLSIMIDRLKLCITCIGNLVQNTEMLNMNISGPVVR